MEYYLTEMDLGNDFDNRIFEPLNQFMWMRNNPDFWFVDYEIEEYKNRLFLSVDAFLRYKAINTFPTSIGTQAIYTWKNDSYSFKDSLRINGEFNDLATEVWKSYKAFVSICKRKLQ